MSFGGDPKNKTKSVPSFDMSSYGIGSPKRSYGRKSPENPERKSLIGVKYEKSDYEDSEMGNMQLSSPSNMRKTKTKTPEYNEDVMNPMMSSLNEEMDESDMGDKSPFIGDSEEEEDESEEEEEESEEDEEESEEEDEESEPDTPPPVKTKSMDKKIKKRVMRSVPNPEKILHDINDLTDCQCFSKIPETFPNKKTSLFLNFILESGGAIRDFTYGSHDGIFYDYSYERSLILNVERRREQYTRIFLDNIGKPLFSRSILDKIDKTISGSCNQCGKGNVKFNDLVKCPNCDHNLCEKCFIGNVKENLDNYEMAKCIECEKSHSLYFVFQNINSNILHGQILYRINEYFMTCLNISKQLDKPNKEERFICECEECEAYITKESYDKQMCLNCDSSFCQKCRGSHGDMDECEDEEYPDFSDIIFNENPVICEVCNESVVYLLNCDYNMCENCFACVNKNGKEIKYPEIKFDFHNSMTYDSNKFKNNDGMFDVLGGLSVLEKFFPNSRDHNLISSSAYERIKSRDTLATKFHFKQNKFVEMNAMSAFTSVLLSKTRFIAKVASTLDRIFSDEFISEMNSQTKKYEELFVKYFTRVSTEFISDNETLYERLKNGRLKIWFRSLYNMQQKMYLPCVNNYVSSMSFEEFDNFIKTNSAYKLNEEMREINKYFSDLDNYMSKINDDIKYMFNFLNEYNDEIQEVFSRSNSNIKRHRSFTVEGDRMIFGDPDLYEIEDESDEESENLEMIESEDEENPDEEYEDMEA